MNDPGPFQPTPEGIASDYEELPARSGPGGWLLTLVHLALGGVAIALAVSEEFAAGKAAFSSDAWRLVLGLIGGTLAFFAVRGIVRKLNDDRPKLTPELHERARRKGWVLVVVGASLVVVSLYQDVGEMSVSFSSWAKPFFVAGGAYLMLLGLAFQWNPTKTIRRQRVARGEGVRGTASIVRAGDTGVTVNEAPQVNITFDIEVNGRRHQVRDRIVMERAKLALLIPGSTVDVLVDRVDPSIFHVYWDSWKPPAPTTSDDRSSDDRSSSG